jgi:hypothetical protein
MVSVHYKNAEKSPAFSGSARRVEVTGDDMGRVLGRLLQHQVDWASPMLTSKEPGADVGALFVDPRHGLPFRKDGRDYGPGSMFMVSYVRACVAALKLEARVQEGAPWLPDDMCPKEFRFAFVGAFYAANTKTDRTELEELEKRLSRLMTTTVREWQKVYSKGQDANAGFGWAMRALHRANAHAVGLDDGSESGEEEDAMEEEEA